MLTRIIPVFATLVIPLMAGAQGAFTQTPYAGYEQRSIKALSAQQIDDLRQGRGMGLALAAELNGFPGPLHVIELAQHLELTDLQRERARALFEAMKAETIPIGERLIAQEAELDRLFAAGTVTPDTLAAATGAIGTTTGALRAAHLRYHVAMLDVLTPSQVRQYALLRGYTGAVHPHEHGGHNSRH